MSDADARPRTTVDASYAFDGRTECILAAAVGTRKPPSVYARRPPAPSPSADCRSWDTLETKWDLVVLVEHSGTCGTLWYLWDPVVGPHCGTLPHSADLLKHWNHNCRSWNTRETKWDPVVLVGPRCGTTLWDRIVGLRRTW